MHLRWVGRVGRGGGGGAGGGGGLRGAARRGPRRGLGARRGPAVTALPDFTFPARKDSRFGVSLAQPMYVELWEIGGARLGSREQEAGSSEIANWVTALYRDAGPVTAEVFESYLHDAERSPLPGPITRAELSWWSLVEMAPTLSGDAAAWRPASELLPSQGLAVLRAGGRHPGLRSGAGGRRRRASPPRA